MKPVRLAVMGAGLMGRQHIGAIARCEGAALACLIDPTPAGASLAAELGVAHHPTLPEIGVDAVIVATPNQLHEAHALAAIERGLPALVEKPLAHNLLSAANIAEAAERSAVPVLVGYHRRHSKITQVARERLASGVLGEVVSVQGTCWLYKPTDYFDADWRTKPGAGPLGINAVHDLDLLQHLLGAIEAVQAMGSRVRRGMQVDDTAVVTVQFASGALGTLNLTDTGVAPWSWELTAHENPAYPQTGQSCYWITGTKGGLELPSNRLWFNPTEPGWWQPMDSTQEPITREDPLDRQIAHFCAVARGEAEPVITAADGLAAMKVSDAIDRSLVSGGRERV